MQQKENKKVSELLCQSPPDSTEDGTNTEQNKIGTRSSSHATIIFIYLGGRPEQPACGEWCQRLRAIAKIPLLSQGYICYQH